ncbi:MAG TPA: SAM-dependent methyltransferase [Steroidobacteraceae bacterium]|jgi:SAM-dependent MidA family methyltransferase|nr:SAM-dependent methyltransferase [Steroidobacteraceae bacterium]
MTGQGTASILPPLDAGQAAHSAAVLQAVCAATGAQGGWLGFDDYLRLVLYAPGVGYYSAGSTKVGRAGDFITAPELSGLFGHALARQCAEVLQRVGGDVLELGAGTGALAATLLPALQQLGSLPRHYDILEVSADLAERARARLAALPETLRARIRWLSALPSEPITGVILANEVADALPFRLFAVGGGADVGGVAQHTRFLERGVALSSEGVLALADRPADDALAAELQRLGLAASLPDGYQSELCLMLGPWVGSLGAALARGAIFVIDYGVARHEYYHEQRTRGTLRCHFRHRAHDDPLLYPGMQDITAWVDFTRVAEAAADAGLTIAGYCTQAAFLLANGIEADVAAASTTLERARLAAQARQLLLPGEMGENFKVMALTRGLDELPLRGFALQDLRRML